MFYFLFTFLNDLKLLLPESVVENIFFAIEWNTLGTTFTIFNSDDLLTFGTFPFIVFKFDFEDDFDLDEKLVAELEGLLIEGGDVVFS